MKTRITTSRTTNWDESLAKLETSLMRCWFFLTVLSLCIAPQVEFRYTAKVLNLIKKYYVPTAWNELQYPD